MSAQETMSPKIGGSYAILGMDIVSFSTLDDRDQVQGIGMLMQWIEQALTFQGIRADDYRWSPAGDGGYLTFVSQESCRKAIDVAFALAHHVRSPQWRPRSGEFMSIRLALHVGLVQEAHEIGGGTNIWGIGINTTARLLSLTTPLQLLVSKPYYDTYIRNRRDHEFDIGPLQHRTVKHGYDVEAMNINRNDLCLSSEVAASKQWDAIGRTWQKTIWEYTTLIHDAMCSDEPIAALAAAKFLLELNEEGPVRELCRVIGQTRSKPSVSYPHRSHEIFGQMSPEMLFEVLQDVEPRRTQSQDVICQRGEPAESCFFPVSGRVIVDDLPSLEEPIYIQPGDITGEFNLWVSNASRIARIRAEDDGLLLEISSQRFKEYLNKAPNIGGIVSGIIKQRILENTLNSRYLFPGANEVLLAFENAEQVACEKYSPGDELDLTQAVYVIFNGKVEIYPEGLQSFIIASEGACDREPVVGIVSLIGSTDGEMATVIEETVAVRLSLGLVEKIQQLFPAVENAWNALYGQRLGQIQKEQLSRAANGVVMSMS